MATVFDIEECMDWWQALILAKWTAKATAMNTRKGNDKYQIRTGATDFHIYIGDRKAERYLNKRDPVIIIDFILPDNLVADEHDYQIEKYKLIFMPVVIDRSGNEESVTRKISRVYQIVREIVAENEAAFRAASRAANGGSDRIKTASIAGFESGTTEEVGAAIFRFALITMEVGIMIDDGT